MLYDNFRAARSLPDGRRAFKRRCAIWNLVGYEMQVVGTCLDADRQAVGACPEDWIERIGRGLVDRSLPEREWTHAAHFAATLWLLRHRHELNLGQAQETLQIGRAAAADTQPAHGDAVAGRYRPAPS